MRSRAVRNALKKTRHRGVSEWVRKVGLALILIFGAIVSVLVENKAQQDTGGLGASFTLNLDCGTNSNRYVQVHFAHQIYQFNITSITCNGVAMTRIYNDSASAREVLYELVGDANIATGVNSIAVTIDTDRSSWMSAISYSGVDQATPSRAVSSASGGPTSQASVSSIVSNSGELLAGFGNEINGRTITNYNGGTAQTYGVCGFGAGWGSTKTSASSSETLTWDFNASTNWKCIGVSIIPASGGGATPINAPISDSLWV